MDKTDTPRIWICPISGARFEADSEENKKGTEVKYDKYGAPIIEWKLKAIDSVNG